MDETENQAIIFRLTLPDGVEHCVLKAPSSYTGGDIPTAAYNIAMIDVSGSMSCYWNDLLTHWNNKLASKMQGKTEIYTFGHEVKFRRSETHLEDCDFDSSSTNLSEGLRVINETIKNRSESFIRVFIVTDGHHNSTRIEPNVEINKMFPPTGKTVEVYLLGVGMQFPVEYSIQIRSRLHQGNANMPSLFWAKNERELEIEIQNITDYVMMGNVKFNVSVEGYKAPMLYKTGNIYPGEYLYYELPPTKVLKNIKIYDEGSEQVIINKDIEDISIELMLNTIFRQWNSVLIQHYNNTKSAPMEAFNIMESAFNLAHDKLPKKIFDNTIKGRLEKKKSRRYTTEFSTLINQSKSIIEVEKNHIQGIELAENILKTTVKSKFYIKNLKMKGHDADSYENDVEKFREIYKANESKIKSLPEPGPEDCCSVTMTSTLKDLQDDEFWSLFDEDKYTLLKTFTMTGIPVFSPVTDSASINPWSIKITRVLVTPYKILSQVCLELSADAGNLEDSKNKSVYLQESDESSKFNAVIPVLSKKEAKVLKPIVRSNIYAMMSTFSILKDAHIIDSNVHFAALACVWLKTITDYPKEGRPEFAKDRLQKITSTAMLYTDRKAFKTYTDILVGDNPTKAFISETQIQDNTEIQDSNIYQQSNIEQFNICQQSNTFDQSNICQQSNIGLPSNIQAQSATQTIRCESLTKPSFLMYLLQYKFTEHARIKLFDYMVTEFLGRCINSRKEMDRLHTKLFVPKFANDDTMKNWIIEKAENIVSDFLKTISSFSKEFYTLEDLNAKVKNYLKYKLEDYCMDDLKRLKIEPNMKFVENLYQPSSAGDVKWKNLMAFADEMEIKHEFNKDKILRYMYHATQNSGSKNRTEIEIPEGEDVAKKIQERVIKENLDATRGALQEKVLKAATELFIKEYMEIHIPVVKPLKRSELESIAQTKGIELAKYKWQKTGLIRNSCMAIRCPYYMLPRRNFNQHISIERANTQAFPHQLHKVTQNFSKEESVVSETIINELIQLKCPRKKIRSNPPTKDQLKSYQQDIEQLLFTYKTFI